MYIIGNGSFSENILEECFFQQFYDAGILNLETNQYVDFLGKVKPAEIDSQTKFVIAHTNPQKRLEALNYIKTTYRVSDDNFPNFIFRDTHVSIRAKLGIGNIISRYADIESKVSIGVFNIIGSQVRIGANTTISNFNSIESHSNIDISCSIGSRNKIKCNSVITKLCSIGDSNSIEPGECLFEDLDNNLTFQSGIVFKK